MPHRGATESSKLTVAFRSTTTGLCVHDCRAGDKVILVLGVPRPLVVRGQPGCSVRLISQMILDEYSTKDAKRLLKEMEKEP
jgi:hypothetical protein